jgi:hypothetical protein
MEFNLTIPFKIQFFIIFDKILFGKKMDRPKKIKRQCQPFG